MIEFEIKIRVRYAETDRMGYVYYGNYSSFFEVARVEMLRSLGINYRDLEDDGVMLPVLEYRIKYYKPAYYDDELTIKVIMKELPGVGIHFDYKTYVGETLVNEADTTLVFVNIKSGRPQMIPDDLLEIFEKHYKKNTLPE